MQSCSKDDFGSVYSVVLSTFNIEYPLQLKGTRLYYNYRGIKWERAQRVNHLIPLLL